MNVSKNTYAIKILISLLIVGVIAGIIVAVTTSSDSETKITPSPPDIEAKWVAVGNAETAGGYETILYSENGKTWTQTSSGDSFRDATAITLSPAGGFGVAYGTSNGTSPLWVAVGKGGTCYGNIMYSTDGKNWTKTSSGDSFTGSGAYGNGVAYGTSDGASPLWVAVGYDGTSGGYGRYYVQYRWENLDRDFIR